MDKLEQPRPPISLARLRGLLLVIVICVFAVSIYPFFVIRPFVHQDARSLTIALVLQRWMPWFTVAAMLASIFLAFRAWAIREERFRILKDVMMVAAVIFVAVLVALSRVNIYENMFHSLKEPKFLSVAEAGIENGDMVMAVRMDGESRAYPVREMAYHHVLNDALNGISTVVTY